MNPYSATLVIRKDPKKLKACLAPELGRQKRSAVTIKTGAKAITLTITADDAVAFRASINGITSALSVYDSMEKI